MDAPRKRFNVFLPIFLQKIGYIVFYIIYKIFVRIEIRGTENVRGIQGPLILAANHTHELDVTVLPLVFSFFSRFFPLYFVANKSEKYKTFGWRSYVYGGKFFNALGGYSVYSGHHDYAISLEDHVTLLRRGNTLCIFPEGKRTRDGVMNPAHGGLGYLAFTTHATTLPVAIDTFFNLSARDFFTFQRKVVITVGKPMRCEEVISSVNPHVEDFQNASQKVLDRIQEMME